MSTHLNHLPRSITESSHNESNSVGHTHAIEKASTKQAGIVKLIDNLDSKSKTEALSANQGRELAERLSLLAQSNGSKEINNRLESALSYMATRYTAAYATYETAKDNLCKHPENSLIYVVNDPTKGNNGLWTVVGGKLVKAPWDTLSSALTSEPFEVLQSIFQGAAGEQITYEGKTYDTLATFTQTLAEGKRYIQDVLIDLAQSNNFTASYLLTESGKFQEEVNRDVRVSLSNTIRTFNILEAGVDPVIGAADGAYFNVRTTEDDTMLVEYRNVGGVATPTGKSYPSSAAVNALKYTTGITDPFSGLTQDKINSYSLTPFHFGAIGDGASHKLSERYTTLAQAQAVYPHAVSLDDEIDWCATQALFNFAISQGNKLQERVDFSGQFHANRTIKYIVPKIGVGGQYRTIYGDVTFSVTDDFIGNELLLIHGRGVTHKGVIKANLRRKVKWGVTLSARGYDPAAVDHISFGNSVDQLFIDNAKVHSVRVLGNAMFANVNFLRTAGSGVGGVPYGGGTQIKADVTSHTHQNVGSLTSQSTMIVSVLPDADFEDSSILATYNGFISRVISIDNANKTIVCRPLFPITSEPMQLSYIYGGAIGTRGSDSAGFTVGKLSQIGCGMAIEHRGMFPVVIESFTSEYAGCAVFNNGLESGIDIKSKYFEGDDYIAVNNSDYTLSGTMSLDWGLNADPSRIVNITYGRNADGSDMPLYGGFRGLRMMHKNIQHQWKYGKLPRNVIPNGASNGFGVDFNAPHENKIYKVPNNVTVGFMPIDENWNRLFGYDSQEFTIVGNGINSAPTGTITIPVLAGYTLNGGTTNLTYSGFNGAAHFKFFLNVATKDIQVSVSGDSAYNLSVGATLANDIDVNSLAVNTKLWFRAATTATNLPTPTTGTKVDGNISTVYSVSALGSAHNKTQVVEYVSLYEKWERVYVSSTGFYGAWRLLSYETKKGTTAQRPSNPQLGMRYYDTTLLAAGKPIEWNGSSWIDMTGATV